MSDGTKEIAAALVKAQKQFDTAKKDRANPLFKSKYADLPSIMTACQAALGAEGVVIMQDVSGSPGSVSVVTKLLHESGQSLSSSPLVFPVMPIKLKDGTLQEVTPQTYGSAITYARRYSLAAMVGVVVDDDDDANHASGRPLSIAPTQPKVTRPVVNVPVDPLVLNLWRSVAAKCADVPALTKAWNEGTTPEQKTMKELRDAYTARVHEIRAAATAVQPAAPTEAA